MSEYIAKCTEVIGIGGNPIKVPDYIDLNSEIVRCRDCRHMGEAHGIGVECWRIGKPFTVWTDGFCAWGERKIERTEND